MDKRALKREMDRLWYAAQHRIWKRCAVCGSPWVEIHHLIPKARLATAWLKENGIGLCPEHHRLSSEFSAHGARTAFLAWLRRRRPEIAAWVDANRERVEPGVNLKEKFEELKQWAIET